VNHCIRWFPLLALFLAHAASGAPVDSLRSHAAPVTPLLQPFSGDYTWMNGQNRMANPSIKLSENVVMTGYFDGYYNYSFNHPKDHTIVGSACIGRDQEFEINLAGIGFNAVFGNVLATLEFQTGSQLNLIQDGDISFGHGRNFSATTLHNIREASAGYHFGNAGYGLNIEMGVFQAFTSLESYLMQENWNYQRSFVADNVPAYLTGVRFQYYPWLDLKTELWIVNGWSTFGVVNNGLALGSSTTYRPTDAIGYILNLYLGRETKNQPGRERFNLDASVLWRYFNKPKSNAVSMMALSINGHAGFESGGKDLMSGAPLQSIDSAHFLGVAFADRIWFDHNRFALTGRIDAMYNPSRYASIAPLPQGFIANYPGDPGYKELLWALTLTFDLMPSDNLTFRLEATSRHADIPFFAGPEGTTSPDGWQGTTGAFLPDLKNVENRLSAALMFRF
jgi:hypothetical protein